MSLRYERKFDWDEARRLRAEGWSWSRIAAHCGVSYAAVRRVCDPQFAARMGETSLRWIQSGRCEDCGAPMSRATSGAARQYHRCQSCAARARANVRDGQAFCSACDTWKPLDEFSPSQQRPARGVHNECRSCDTARRRRNREENRERERAYDRARRRRERAAA